MEARSWVKQPPEFLQRCDGVGIVHRLELETAASKLSPGSRVRASSAEPLHTDMRCRSPVAASFQAESDGSTAATARLRRLDEYESDPKPISTTFLVSSSQTWWPRGSAVLVPQARFTSRGTTCSV